MSSNNTANETTEPVAAAKTYRPNELASELGVDGKLVRGFLRTKFTRPVELKNSTWILDENVANVVREHFNSRKTTADAQVVTVADAK
jgi:hypothetical protein